MKMQKLGGYAVIAWICLIVVLLVVALSLALRYGLTDVAGLLLAIAMIWLGIVMLREREASSV